jgi:DNA-binding LacI/PurR family transcriptional regulator
MASDRITLKAIAKAAEVSVSTASRVLSGAPGISAARRAQVLAAAERLGWAAEGGASSVTVLSAIDISQDGVPDFLQELLRGITGACKELGLPVSMKLLSPEVPFDAADLPRAGEGARHGVILLSLDRPDAIAALAEAGVPAVIVNGLDFASRLPSVSSANRSGGYVAAKHLLDLGHRRILRLTHDRRQPIRDRFSGADIALAEAGLVHDPALSLPLEQMNSMCSYQAMREALAAKLSFTAVQSCNDVSALGAMNALAEAGLRVPEDISVVGFDDIPSAAFALCPLTTIGVPRPEMGAEGVRLLLRRMREPEATCPNNEIAGQLILRRSTAPLQGRGIS